MANLPEIIASMDNGKGVYQGDAKFLMPDGSVTDRDGKEVLPASVMGAAKHASFVGYLPLTAIVPAAQLPLATDAARGAVLAATKGVGDTVVCKIGTDGKLYVPTYPADTQYDMTGFMVEVDSVEAAKPVAYNDDDYWVKDGEAELYQVVDGAWVLVTDSALTESATEPAEPADGDYWLDTDDDGLFKYVTDAWVEFTTEAVVVAATAPTLYPVGYLLADTDTKKIYEREAADWDAGTSLVAGKLYTDGTDLYVFGSGSLAKV